MDADLPGRVTDEQADIFIDGQAYTSPHRRGEMHILYLTGVEHISLSTPRHTIEILLRRAFMREIADDLEVPHVTYLGTSLFQVADDPVLQRLALRICPYFDAPRTLDPLHADHFMWSLTVEKPASETSLYLLTMLALRHSLQKDLQHHSWKHAQSEQTFSTAARRFSPWSDIDPPPALAIRRPDPRELVREAGDPSVPARIAPWLLDMPLSLLPDGDPVFEAWMTEAVKVSRRCLASEILVDGTIVYPGPPKVKVASTDIVPSTSEAFIALQRALRWVYESGPALDAASRVFLSTCRRS